MEHAKDVGEYLKHQFLELKKKHTVYIKEDKYRVFTSV